MFIFFSFGINILDDNSLRLNESLREDIHHGKGILKYIDMT